MAKLNELIRALQRAPEKSVREQVKPVFKPGMRRTERGKGVYTISVTGDDAVLHFGKHKGAQISSLASSEPDYLRWLIKEAKEEVGSQRRQGKVVDFVDEDLIDIIHYQLGQREQESE